MVKKNSFVPVQDLAGNFIEVPAEEPNITMEVTEIKKRGRPKKYATAEEARKAKIANTIASAKRRKEKQGKGAIIDHLTSIFTGTASPSDYVIFVLAKVALFLLHRKSKKILKERYGIDKSWFPILKLLAEGTKEAYSRAIGQGGANIIRNLAQVVADLPAEDDAEIEQEIDLEGGTGLYSAVKNLANKAKDAVVGVANKVKDAVVDKVKSTIKTTKAVIYGRDDYPPKVRDTISKYGDKIITGITLGRTPLGKPLMTALQLASGNTFSQKLENTPYDKLFHLFMCIEFGDGKIILEKNEVINTENSCKLPKETETKVITSGDMPNGLTLIDTLNKTKERMGGKFFTYSAKDNNCQDFIVAFLTANNIGTETDKSWVKQETKVLFEGNTRLRKIANTLTDIGARVDIIRQGAGHTTEHKTKEGGAVWKGATDPEFLKEYLRKKEEQKKLEGGEIKSNTNTKMANKWIEYVKAYAKKNNMKYNEALKDPKCKAGYKSGEGIFDVLKEVGKAVAPVAIDLASNYAKKKIGGRGIPTSREEYISQLYDQANLGANGKVKLGKK